jgi:NAD(P) transhydrogenase subunit beta
MLFGDARQSVEEILDALGLDGGPGAAPAARQTTAAGR